MGIIPRKPPLALVFDIGSASVGAAIFEIGKNKVPKILYSIREPILLLPTLDLEQLLSLVFKTLDSVLGKAAKGGVGAPSMFFCVLGPTWHASQTRIVRYAKNTNFAFTTKLADELIQKEIHLFKEEQSPQYLEEGEMSVPIELKSLKIALNGYAVEHPLDRKAKELEMTILVSIAGKFFLEKVEAAVREHFHRDALKFSTLLIATYTIVRDLYLLPNFIMVDIGGELTAIALVKHDTLAESATFPMGKNFIIRETSKALGTSLDETRSLISLYQGGHADERVGARLAKAIGSARTEWLNHFEETLAHLSNDISIPSDIFISAGEELAGFFAETIQNERLSQYTLTDSKFRIKFLNVDALYGKVEFMGNARHDFPLAVEAIYINRYLC